MRIGTESAYVDIEHTGEQYREDACYSVRAYHSGFSGDADYVWISAKLSNEFLKDLELLRQDRTGEAELENLGSKSEVNPSEFRIVNVDPLGHIGVVAKVRLLVGSGRSSTQLTTSIAF